MPSLSIFRIYFLNRHDVKRDLLDLFLGKNEEDRGPLVTRSNSNEPTSYGVK